MGAFAPAAHAWELGHSGIHVQKTPQSLLVTSLDANSPAILARLPRPGAQTMRLLYVNGIPALDLYAQDKLASAFSSSSVLVTLGVREGDETEEHLAGPFVLDLVDAPGNRIKRLLASKQWKKAAALAGSGQLDPDQTQAVYARLALEAAEYARSEQWQQAIALADLVPVDDPAHHALLAQLPGWRLALSRTLTEDRRLTPHEVRHAGPYPRRLAMQKRAKERQGARPHRDPRS